MNGVRSKMERGQQPGEREEETSFTEYAKGSDYQPSSDFQVKFSIRSTLNEGQLGGKILSLQQFLNRNHCEAVKAKLHQHDRLRSLDLKSVTWKTKELILSFSVYDEDERKILEKEQDSLAEFLQQMAQSFKETKDCDMKFYCKTDFTTGSDFYDPVVETGHISPKAFRKRNAFDLCVQITFYCDTSTIRDQERKEVEEFIKHESKKSRLIHVLREKTKLNVSKIIGRTRSKETEDFGFDIIVTVNDISEYDAVAETDIHGCLSSFFESSRSAIGNKFSVNIANESECQRHFGQKTVSRAQVMVKRQQSLPDFTSDEDRTLSFFLFIPESICKTTLSVSVVLKSAPGKFMKQELRKEEITSPHQKPKIVTLWRSGEISPQEQYVTFMYRRKSSIDGVEHTDGIERHVTARQKIRRDRWANNDHSDESRSTHVLNIMRDVCESSIKEKMREISEFTRTSGLMKLTETIKSYHLSYQAQPFFQMLYLYFLSISNANVTREIERVQAQQIIIKCGKCEGSVFPKEDIERICDTVFKLAKKADFSWANLVMFSHNFLETENNLQLFDKYKGTDIEFKGKTYGTDKVDLERRKKTILSLMKTSCSSDRRESDLNLIRKLFMADLDWAFIVYGEIIEELKNLEGFGHVNRNLRNFFESHMEEETRRAENSMDLSRMPRIWKLLKGANLSVYEGDFANIVFRVLRTVSKPGQGSQDQCKANADAVEELTILGAFDGAYKQKELLLASISTYSYYRLFPRLVGVLNENITVSNSDMLTILGKYLDLSLGKNKSFWKDQDILKEVFEDFEAIYDVRSTMMDTCRETLITQFEKNITSFMPQTIIKTVGTIDTWEPNTAKLFFKFAKTLIEMDPLPYRKDAESFCASNSVLRHKHQASCLRIIIDSFAFTEDFEKDILLVLEKPSFWTGVLNVKGKYSEPIKSSPSFQVVYSTLTKLSERLDECDIKESFLNDLSCKEENLKLMFIHSNIPEHKLSRGLTDCLEKRKRCNELCDQCLRLLIAIRDRYNQANHQSLYTLMENCRSHFSRCKEEYVTNEINLFSYWNELTSTLNTKNCAMPTQWSTLCEIIESQVFWNIEFHSQESKLAERAVVQHESSVHDAVSLVTYLSIAGIRNYKEFWGKENVDLGEAKMVFSEVKDIHLEEEKAKDLMRFDRPPQIPVKIMKMALDIPSKQTFLQETEHVWKFLLPNEVDDRFNGAMRTFHGILKGDSEILDVKLKEIGEDLEYLLNLPEAFDENYTEILREIAKAEELIKFLHPLLNQDITYLVDAVEEFVEQLVPEHAVSALMSTKDFIQQLLSERTPTVSEFLDKLEKTCEGIEGKDIRIARENLSGLMSLYNGLSDKESMAKEIISKVLDEGRVKFLQVGEKLLKCESNVLYSRTDKNKVLSSQKLQDYRSQALFIASYNKVPNKEDEKIKMKEFVNIVEQIFSISQLIDDLQDLGHYKYGKLDKEISVRELNEFEDTLEDDKADWKASLNSLREKYHWLNYVYGEQLQLLHGFLQDGQNRKEVMNVLKYIHPEISMLSSKVRISEKSSGTSLEVLECIGKYLVSIFEGVKPIKRSFEIERTSSKLKDTIIKGRLLIVRVDKTNSVFSRTILALYLNTTKLLPEPHQLVICDHKTKWNEIHLLLKRCIESGKMNHESVFCIAGVECLNSEMKLRLANELKLAERRTDKFRLGLIFKGGIHEAFLQYFKNYVVRVDEIATLNDKEMDNCFHTHCKHIEVISSDVSGLGKSEYIARTASERKLALIRFHISGKFDKRDLLLDLRSLSSSKYTAIHIDIGSMDEKHAIMLDNFLFEIMILRIAKCGTLICPLISDCLFIEIPNTLEDLVNYNLPTLRHLRSKHFTQNLCMELFVSSQDPGTSVQIVCNYLKSLEEKDLDTKDISVTDMSAIPSYKCFELINNIMTSKRKSLKSDNLTFTNIKTFVDLLAYQLNIFSRSSFCKVENTRRMIISRKGKQGIRSSLVHLLIERALEITSFAVRSGQHLQSKSLAAKAYLTSSNISDENVSDDMPKWVDCINALLLFNNDGHSITPLYRNISEVPEDIRCFFKNQTNTDLPDSIYQSSSSKSKKDLLDSQNELSTKLLRIVRSHRAVSAREIDKNYVLTPDNMLKMVLIHQRIKAKLPVVIVGETGCGKTSLIRYLADVCNISKSVFNIHAGLSKQDICARIQDENERAKENMKQQLWLFLDEINTTDYIGVLTSVLCHRRLFTETISPNLTIIAACNPYRLRSKSNIYTEGLDSKVRNQDDKMSRLVYRVHPLPESMLCHVWDFGIVTSTDERYYIVRMIEKSIEAEPEKGKILSSHLELIVDLISVSLKTVREFEREEFSVSLRDIDRCVRLSIFFIDYLRKRNGKRQDHYPITAVVLSLAHCFFYRFREMERRKKYLGNIAKVFEENKKPYKEADIENAIVDEQTFLLDSMIIPDKTARNSALRENVFVLIVSILTKIPIFLVGQPGCSKSLSVQLIRRNLKGPTSENDFLRKLPHVIFFSYQGSEASTSIGIQNVFDRAKRYQENNDENKVRTVVLLDEVGLAEVSPNNPLKILHSLLEPDGRRTPDVAVIGISNWALDAAKMNRAIHLSRPKMSLKEITSTVSEIGSGETESLSESVIEAIASAYMAYDQDQSCKHFHGLRDIYALMKYLTSSFGPIEDRLSRGLRRNFGGQTRNLEKVFTIFSKKLSKHNILLKETKTLSVLDMIEENLKDKNSRHLMLICNGDVGIPELKRILNEQNRPFEIMLGSSFPQDQSEEFDNNSLTRVILCMEKGKVLILKDFHSIYGSLYDMLNCNYMSITEKAKNEAESTKEKRYCRIAYGQYSNPMCVVHEFFKCVVIVSEDEVLKIDPPFLNRFEKQTLSIRDLVNEGQMELAKRIEKNLKRLQPKDDEGSAGNIVAGYSTDMVLSVTLRLHNTLQQLKDGEDEKLCIQYLLPLMKPECIIRFDESRFYELDGNFVQTLSKRFNTLPVNHGLSCLLRYVQDHTKIIEDRCESSTPLDNDDLSLLRSSSSGLFVVFTHCNIHREYEIGSDVSSKIVKISDIESQQELVTILDEFYRLDSSQNIILHLNYQDDADHIDVVKNVAETFLYKSRKSIGSKRKFVYLLIHLQRPLDSIKTMQTYVNFASDWTFVYVDDLQRFNRTVADICHMSLYDIISRREEELASTMKKELPWSFTRIQYETGNERDIEGIQQCIEYLSSPEMMRFLYELVSMTIKPIKDDEEIKDSVEWIKSVSKDRKLMFEASTFRGAIERYVERTVVDMLAKVIYRLEDLGALDALHSSTETNDKQEYIKRSVQDIELLAVDSMQQPSGPGCYIVRNYRKRRLPLSGKIFEQLKKVSAEGHFEGTLDERRVVTFTSFIRDILDKVFSRGYDELLDDYIYDFCESCTEQHSLSLDRAERQFIWFWSTKNVFMHFIPSKCCSIYIENQMRKKTNAQSRILTGEWKNTDDAYEVVSVLHLIRANFKPRMDSILRLLALAKSNFGIDILEFLQTRQPSIPSVKVMDTILQQICSWFITDRKYLEHTSPIVWNGNALSLFSIAKNILLSADHDISQNTESYHVSDEIVSVSTDDILELQVLRYCCDLVSSIMVPLNLPTSELTRIFESLMNMGASKTVNTIHEFLFDMRQSNKPQSKCIDVDQLLAYYVVRCLVFKEDSFDVLNEFLDLIDCGKIQPRFWKSMIGTLIDNQTNILSDDSDNYLSRYIESVEDEDIEEMEVFMDHIIAKLKHVHGAMTTIVEILEDDIMNNGTFNEELIRNALGNIEVPENVTFKYLVSVAYMRVVTKFYTDKKIQDKTDIDKDTVLEMLKSNKYIALYLARLLPHRPTEDFDHLSRDDQELWKRFNIYDNPLALYCSSNMYMDFTQEWDNNSLSFCEEGINDSELLAFCGILYAKIYTQETISWHSPSDEFLKKKDYAKRLVENASSKRNKHIHHFLKCIACDVKFDGICSPQKVDDIPPQLASFIVQLGSVVLCSFPSSSLWYKLITIPDCAFNTYVPGQSLPTRRESFCITCVCGCRSNAIISDHVPVCPSCDKKMLCDCKREVHSSKRGAYCRTCKRFIHRTKVEQTFVKTGFQLENYENRKLAFYAHGTDKLPFITFRFIEMLVFGCLSVARSIGSDVKSFKDNFSDEFFECKLHQVWSVLCKLLNVSDAELQQLLQTFLFKFKDDLKTVEKFENESSVRRWERRFSDSLLHFLEDRTEETLRLVQNHNQLYKIDRECFVDETDETAAYKSDMYDLFRVVVPGSPANMLCELELRDPNQEKHPFLRLVLKYSPLLCLPKYLPMFLNWYNVSTNYCRYKMTRAQRKTLTVVKFIENHAERKYLFSEFYKTQKHWNKLCGELKDLERLGFEVPKLCTLGDSTSVEECMVTTKQSQLQHVVFFLANIQNDFLDRVLELDSDCPHLSTNLMKGKNGISFIPQIALTHIGENDLFDFDMNEICHEFSQSLPYTGQGNIIMYDFFKIHMESMMELLEGKSCIQMPENLFQIEFKDDLFNNSASLLNDVRAKLPQHSLDVELEKQLIQQLNENPSLASELLSTVGILLNWIRKSQEDEYVTVAEYLDRWKETHNLRSYRDVEPLMSQKLTIGNIVPLYLLLERVLGDRLLKSSSENSKLETDSRQKLHQLPTLAKENLADAVCVFAYRALSIENKDMNHEDCLVDHLDNLSYWNVERLSSSEHGTKVHNQDIGDPKDEAISDPARDVKELLQHVHRDIKIKHSKSLHLCIQEKQGDIQFVPKKKPRNTIKAGGKTRRFKHS